MRSNIRLSVASLAMLSLVQTSAFPQDARKSEPTTWHPLVYQLPLKRVAKAEKMVVKPDVLNPDKPALEYCTYDESTGAFGPVWLDFGGFQNRVQFDTCVFLTETVYTNRDGTSVTLHSVLPGSTTEYLSDRHWTNQQNNVGWDITINGTLFDSTQYQSGQQVPIAQIYIGEVDRDCVIGSKHAMVGDTYIPGQTGSILDHVADHMILTYSERGLDQC